MTGRGKRVAGLGVLAASGVYLVGWWWLGPPEGAVLPVGAVWVGLVLAGSALAYGRDG